jgi:pantoate--beta-alanine ligase
MGFLHEGHLSLVQASKENSDSTIVSIFINPTQFAPNEDLSSYPKDIDRDSRLLEEAGVDYLFLPSVEEIYPEGYQTYVDVTEITKHIEGEFRPSHFKGVTSIVAMLFNITKPHVAFFGQKDAQQAAVIKRMVTDLKYDIEIVVYPIVRDDDGLAKSSRNTYLSTQDREKALLLSRSLFQARDLIKAGERNVGFLIKKINNNFIKESSVHLNYIRMVNASDFKEIDQLQTGNDYYILIAARVGKTRLIDNILISV